MTEENTTAEKGEESIDKTAKRAKWEGFEYRVPCEGTVRVENGSYGDKSDEHVTVVTVTHGSAESCGCKAYEYQEGPCKHMLAVDAHPAVLMAASPEIEIDTDTTETDQNQAVADGGQVIVADTSEPYDVAYDEGECVCDSSLTDLSCFEHFTLDDESMEGDR
jgi:hypothetical protein